MQKMKKLVAFLLVLTMAVSLLPTLAMADDPEPEYDPTHPADVESGGMHLAKSYDAQTGYLTLEAYATGSTVITTTEEAIPSDIVLVLDVSGSMDDYINVSNRQDTSNLRPEYASLYRYHRVLATFEMKYENGQWYYYDNIGFDGDQWRALGNAWFGDGNVRIKKSDALKISVSDFIDEVQSNAAANNVDHQIGIVKFANDSYYNSSESSLAEGNHIASGWFDNGNYTEVLKNLTKVNDSGAASLKDAVNALHFGGATAADYGMKKASHVINPSENSLARADSNKVVILFTDGTPTHGSGYDDAVAMDAINTSNTIKSNGVTVFSIGVFEDSSDRVDQYMNGVSSNYPNAQVIKSGSGRNVTYSYQLGTGSNLGYYQNATTSSDLSAVFVKIAQQSTSGSSAIQLSTASVLRDVISEYFDLPENAVASDIAVHSATYQNGQWTDNSDSGSYTVTIDEDRKTIDVAGFDYSKYYVDLDATGKNANGVYGRKIIVRIPIVMNPDAAIEEGCIVNDPSAMIPTNDDSSGVYDDTDNDPETLEPIEEFPIPATEVSTFTIVHCGDTVHESPVPMKYVAADGFDFTETVLEGAIYGGTFTDAACLKEPVANGKNTNPAAGETYYLWEVSSDHLKPKNLCAYADNEDGYYVEAVYLVTAVDRDAYKNVGFIVSDNKTLANASQIEVDASNGYADINSKKVAYEKIQLTQGGKTVGTYTYYQAYGKIAPTTENSLISCYRLDTISNVPFYSYKQENPFYFKAFWTTLDNVLVASSDAREAYYQSADGKSLVVSDHEGYRFWAVHAQEVLDDDTLGEAMGSAPLKMMASYSYDQEDSADIVAVPMRMLLAAPKPAVEEPEEPIDDPVVPETPEYIEVIDNGESYQAQIIAGAVTLEPVGANGKVFAGWYADEAYTKAADLSAVQDGETVYAKYISDDYLSVKYTASLLAKKLTLVSAIDARDYVKTGFIVEIGDEKKVIPVTAYTNSYLLASARSLFGSSIAKNAPIMTCELNLAGVKKNTAIKVTPFAIAKDGTEIIGETRTMVYTGFSIKG